MRTLHGICVVVVAGAAVSCGGSPKKVDDAPEQATLRKLDGYLQCHLDHSSLVFHTEDLYRLDFADGPPGPDRVVVVTATPDPSKCIEGIAAAKALPPAMPELEAAGAAYATELARVHRLTSTYDRAKAVELHGELMAAFDAFDRAEAALYDQVYSVNRKMHLAQLAQREKKEENGDLVIERAQLAGEDVARFAAVPWNQLDKLDPVAFATSIGGLESAVESLHEFQRQEPDQARLVAGFDEFRDNADALVTAARQLALRAHDNVQYTDAEKVVIRAGNEASVVGTPAAIAHAYNRVADPR